MSNNATCKCGSPGYQGLFAFECSNEKCAFYVKKDEEIGGVAKSGFEYNAPNIIPMNKSSLTVSATLGPPGTIFANVGSTPPAPLFATSKMQSFAAFKRSLSVTTQACIGFYFLNELISSNSVSEARIMGGAPRDWYVDKMATDIDIFCKGFDLQVFLKTFPSAKIASANKKTNQNIPLPQTLGTQSTVATYSGSFSVWDVEWLGEIFQIIDVSSSLAEHILTFDFGINMIAVDQLGNVELTSFYERDLMNGTLTFFPKLISGKTLRNLNERFDKMINKFPGFYLKMSDETSP